MHAPGAVVNNKSCTMSYVLQQHLPTPLKLLPKFFENEKGPMAAPTATKTSRAAVICQSIQVNPVNPYPEPTRSSEATHSFAPCDNP